MKKIIRILLNITGVGHFVEFGLALYENAYITATIGLLFGVIELTAGYLLLDEVEVNKK